MRNLAKSIAVVALGAMVTAFGSAGAQQLIRVGLPVPADASHAPAAVAAERLGYYKAANLNVEFTIYRGGAAAQEAMSAGAADIINYFPPAVALAVSKGAKEKIVGAGSNRAGGWHYLVRPDSPTKTFKDLAGKKVGITTKASTTDLLTLWMADRSGVSVQTVPVGGGGLVPSLKTGQVDAIILFPGVTYRLMLSGEARSIFDFGKDTEPSLPDLWVASQDILDKHPEQVRAFLGAVYRAVDYMQKNRDFGVPLLKEFTKEENEKALLMTYEDVTLQQSNDGVIQREWIARMVGVAAKAWGIKELASVKIDDFFTDRFIPGRK